VPLAAGVVFLVDSGVAELHGKADNLIRDSLAGTYRPFSRSTADRASRVK